MYGTVLFYCIFPVIVGLIFMEYREELISIVKSKVIGEIPIPRYKLVVGVLSARDHFEQRQAIRETWWRHIQQNKTLAESVDVKFIIGDSGCGLHEDDLVDSYSCRRWHTTASDDRDDIPLMEEVANSSQEQEQYSHNYGVHSVSFKVRHAVILQQLGVHTGSVGKKTAVKLLDGPTKTEIISVELTAKNPGKFVGGYRYKPVEPYLLPKGFEGILQVENLSKAQLTTRPVEVKVNFGGGVIHLLQAPVDSEDHYNDALAWNARRIPLPSMIYQLKAKDYLQHHSMTGGERADELSGTTKREMDKLAEENRNHDDLVFVDVTDVYRNIPNKLLKFYSWLMANSSFEFVLKTDDDCYLDVERVLSELEKYHGTEKFWWGRFRRDWMVEHYGKWADLVYPAMVYPAFACGVGSVLSKDLVRWMADNAHVLHTYQGEDVSVGIWLAAVGPHCLDDPRWQCEKECLSDMIAMPQLSPDELRQTWKHKLQCDDPCGCS